MYSSIFKWSQQLRKCPCFRCSLPQTFRTMMLYYLGCLAALFSPMIQSFRIRQWEGSDEWIRVISFNRGCAEFNNFLLMVIASSTIRIKIIWYIFITIRPNSTTNFPCYNQVCRQLLSGIITVNDMEMPNINTSVYAYVGSISVCVNQCHSIQENLRNRL